MAYESYYWRRLIKREASYIEKKQKLLYKDIEHKPEEHYSYLEIKIMILAYSARKLADTNKLPDKTLGVPEDCPLTGL